MLEEAGYITVDETSDGRRPKTFPAATAAGRAAFDAHVHALRDLFTPLQPENITTMNKPQIIAFSLTLLAVLCFIAGSPAFGFIPRAPANFAGIAILFVAGVFWVLTGRKKSGKNGG
jgi:hypothetical protein